MATRNRSLPGTTWQLGPPAVGGLGEQQLSLHSHVLLLSKFPLSRTDTHVSFSVSQRNHSKNWIVKIPELFFLSVNAPNVYVTGLLNHRPGRAGAPGGDGCWLGGSGGPRGGCPSWCQPWLCRWGGGSSARSLCPWLQPLLAAARGTRLLLRGLGLLYPNLRAWGQKSSRLISPTSLLFPNLLPGNAWDFTSLRLISIQLPCQSMRGGRKDNHKDKR